MLLEEDSINIADRYDFSQYKTVVEVMGQANKPLLVNILKANPEINGLIFGQPNIIDELKHKFNLEAIKSQCRTTTGNYFNYLPLGFNIYIISDLLDNMVDQQVQTFLKNISNSTEQYARIILITNEKSRQLPAFNDLFKISDFLITNVIQINDSHNLLEVLKL